MPYKYRSNVSSFIKCIPKIYSKVNLINKEVTEHLSQFSNVTTFLFENRDLFGNPVITLIRILN